MDQGHRLLVHVDGHIYVARHSSEKLHTHFLGVLIFSLLHLLPHLLNWGLCSVSLDIHHHVCALRQVRACISVAAKPTVSYHYLPLMPIWLGQAQSGSSVLPPFPDKDLGVLDVFSFTEFCIKQNTRVSAHQRPELKPKWCGLADNVRQVGRGYTLPLYHGLVSY